MGSASVVWERGAVFHISPEIAFLARLGANGRRKGGGRVGSRRTTMRSPGRPILILVVVVVIALAAAAGAAFYFQSHNGESTPSNTTTTNSSSQWRILYVNQGNAYVGENNFSSLISTARSNNFNTIFFQVYRSGELLYSTDQLQYFVAASHDANISIFFAFYLTDPSNQIPVSVYSLGENGINLDMSILSPSVQASILSSVKSSYHSGKIAITTTDFTTTLKPDLLILETYQEPADQQYIHPGIIAGVEPLATQNQQDYEQQVQYALSHSDGVMVFDYYGLSLRGY